MSLNKYQYSSIDDIRKTEGVLSRY